MPSYYEFTRTKTGNRISLNTIDREVCEWWKVPVNSKQYNPSFDTVVLVALGCLRRYGGSTVTDVYLNAYLSDKNDPFSPMFCSFAREFLLHRYTVNCWYSPR